MGGNQKPLLAARILNGWSLFWLISVPMCLVIVTEMMSHDLSQAPDVSEMIGYSVRFAVPIIFLVVAISALQKLWPNTLTHWLLRNRKYIGLCFAVAMAWQGLFIAMMSNVHRGYYYEEIFFFRDELEGSTGYIFLTAMVLTSFRFGRRFLDAQQWKLLHTSGLYFLWAYPFSVYWWNLYYYGNPEPIDYFFYWFGFSAFALRIAAWGKDRLRASMKTDDGAPSWPAKIVGGVLVTAGLIVSATGLQWQNAVSEFLTGPEWSATLELWLPYWPFEPFLSLFVIGLGTLIATRSDLRAAPAAEQSAA